MTSILESIKSLSDIFDNHEKLVPSDLESCGGDVDDIREAYMLEIETFINTLPEITWNGERAICHIMASAYKAGYVSGLKSGSKRPQ